MKTQTDKILRHIRYKPLTPLQALRDYSCMRLAARIRDLREQGYTINSKMVEVKNKAGEICRVAEYRLVK